MSNEANRTLGAQKRAGERCMQDLLEGFDWIMGDVREPEL
jgi:hypothetical protein